MSIRPYFPTSAETICQETGIILVNHAGAIVSQDTGRDAQALADNLSLTVLAANRPGTSGFIPRLSQRGNLASLDGYITETTKLGYSIDRLAGGLGLKRLIIAGRSAGGLGALALARSETISDAQYVFAAEPAGCKAVSKKEGIQMFKDYGVFQKHLQQERSDILVPPHSNLPRLQATIRIGSIVKNILYDRFHNSAIWASDAAVAFSRHLAEHQPNIATTVSFAEYSLVTNDQTYHQELAPIATLRTSGSPFIINRIPATTHASFDDRNFFASLVKPIAEQARFRS